MVRTQSPCLRMYERAADTAFAPDSAAVGVEGRAIAVRSMLPLDVCNRSLRGPLTLLRPS